MKKFVTPLLYSVLLLISFTAFSQPIASDRVQKYAVDFMNTHGGVKSSGESKITPFQVSEDALTVYTYVVNLQPQGWVLMSADEKVEPVLAYSEEGRFSSDEIQHLPFYFWFDAYKEQIREIVASNQLEKNTGWQQMTKSEKATAIEPIIQVKWNQNKGWNDYCPEDAAGPGGRAYAGCVAVAMAQNMSVFGYPTIGRGSKTYVSNYGSLTANFGDTYYNWDSTQTSSANEHSALILYHLGIAVEMNYTGDGSGAFSHNVPGAIKSYFDYSKEARMIARKDYEEEEWADILADELKQGRAVYYAGNANNNQAGHAFNLDGMDGSGRFHFNWGWGGSYNGYFYLNALNPGSSNDFSSNQDAIINFKPRNHAPQDINLSNKTILEKLEPGTEVGTLSTVDETPGDTHTYVVEGPESVFGFIIAVPFDVDGDKLITTEELDYTHKNRYEIFVTVTDSLGRELKKKFYIDVLENDSSAGATNVAYDKTNRTPDIKIWSARSNELNFSVKNDYTGEFFVELYDITGRKIDSGRYYKSSNDFQDKIVTDTSLHTGIYFLSLNMPGMQRISRKFIHTIR